MEEDDFEDNSYLRTDLRIIPKDILKEFIDTYRAHPALWEVKNRNVYNNKSLKVRGYRALVDVWKRYDPLADDRMVKTKVQSIRGSFRKELRKVEKSQETENGEVYRSHLWYYRYLTFLIEEESPAKTGERKMVPEATQGALQEFKNELESSGDEDKRYESVLSRSVSARNTKSSSNLNNIPEMKRKTEVEQERTVFVTKCNEILNSKLNESEAFGQYISTKMEKVTNPEQRMYAEALISKVLNKAIMERLNEFTDITDNYPATFS